jgi:hypothetical protein
MSSSTQTNQDAQDSLYALGLSAEDRRAIFVSAFPELAHISHLSSQQERNLAAQKLGARLGVRITQDE